MACADNSQKGRQTQIVNLVHKKRFKILYFTEMVGCPTVSSDKIGHHPKCQDRIIETIIKDGMGHPQSQVSRRKASQSTEKPGPIT